MRNIKGGLRNEREYPPIVVSEKQDELIILNDAGGAVMCVSKEKVGTLRAQMKHHEPIVCYRSCYGGGGRLFFTTICQDGKVITLTATEAKHPHAVVIENDYKKHQFP